MSQEYEKIRKITNENDGNTKRNVVEEETLFDSYLENRDPMNDNKEGNGKENENNTRNDSKGKS